MDLNKWSGLRVVVASRRLYPANGGGELSLLAIARHLQAQGAAVTLAFHGGCAVPGFSSRALPEPVRAPGMWNKQVANRKAWQRSLAGLLRRDRPDVVLTQQEVTAAAVDAARSEGVRSLAMIRGTDFLALPSTASPGAWRHYLQLQAFRQTRRGYLRALRMADAVTANSRFIAEYYEPLIGRTPGVVYPAVECTASSLNSIHGHFVMLSPHAHKGGHIVLEMARQMPERRFVVAGNGEREIVEPLRRLPNVEYHEWMERPDVLFHGACATLIPTQMIEAFGRVAIESQAHGVPVIASDRGGLPESTGGAGVLIQRWNRPEKWVQAARFLTADPDRYREIASRASQHAAGFDPAAQMREFDRVLERTLNSPRLARTVIAGVPVDPVTLPSAVREIERVSRSGRQLAVTTVNSEFIVQSLADPAFRHALASADLAVPDSFGVTLALARRGLGASRCPGVDLTRGLAASGLRLFLLGSTESVLAASAVELRALHPATAVDYYAPPFGDLEGAETVTMIERVNAFRPDVLLVALGAPKQDVWIARNLSRLRTGAAIGVGGTFDMVSGRLSRCPKLVGVLGFEWAYRLTQEPSRWRRCLRLVRFLPMALAGSKA